MCKTLAAVLFFFVVVLASTLAGIFVVNWDTWCATPNIGSNHVIQPLCK